MKILYNIKIMYTFYKDDNIYYFQIIYFFKFCLLFFDNKFM